MELDSMTTTLAAPNALGISAVGPIQTPISKYVAHLLRFDLKKKVFSVSNNLQTLPNTNDLVHSTYFDLE